MFVERGDEGVMSAGFLPHDPQETLQWSQQSDATYAGCCAKNEVFVKRLIIIPGDRPVVDGSFELDELRHSPKVGSCKG